jgi:hypothetical protein
MKIINNETPTSEISAVKIGDQISNGLGTFGEVKEISFENNNDGWLFKFELVGGGLISANKVSSSC